MAIKVITDKCPQDHICPALKVCPVQALEQDGLGAPTVDADLCIECAACTDYCPKGALVME